MPIDPRILLMGEAPKIDGPMDLQTKGLALKKAGDEDQIRKLEMVGRLASSVKDQASLDNALNVAKQNNWDTSAIPSVYDPSTAPIFKSIADRALSVSDKYNIDQRMLDRKDAREERRWLHNDKQQELSSTQAKQLGNYELGQMAENQYKKAVSNPSEYNPTEPGQWIDNSQWAPNWLKNDKAVQSQSAQSNWIETFLRDASGAAIAPSERMNYAKDYFPQPGDSVDVVANKEALRKQKMSNALIGAGRGAQKLLAKQQQAPKEETKVVGGKTYKKVPGGWQEVSAVASK